MTAGEYHAVLTLLRQGNLRSTRRARQQAIREALSMLGACDYGVRKLGISKFKSLDDGWGQATSEQLSWYLDRLLTRAQEAGAITETEFAKRSAVLRAVGSLVFRLRNRAGGKLIPHAHAIRALFTPYGGLR